MYNSIAEIRRANRRAGYHFFDRSTMRFFDSKVYRGVYKFHDGALFITSEQYHGSTRSLERRYTVRCAYANGDIVSHGGFQEFADYKTARAFARSSASAWREDHKRAVNLEKWSNQNE